MHVDVHQHLLPERLLAELARRHEVPRIRSSRDGWLLEVAGEAPGVISPLDHDPIARAAQADSEGLGRVLVSLSPVLGIEALPRDEAAPLLEAWETGVRELPARFRRWGAISLESVDPDEVDRQLATGAVGITLPAGALASEAALRRSGPLLDRLEQRGGAVFVHPGPDPWAPAAGSRGSAPWLVALTRYVAEMNAAWHVFAGVRARLPRLRVLFAMLAGLAPLHVERLRARGGPAGATSDENLFYDTSSYGPQAVRALARIVGPAQLVYGSDIPIVEPHPQVAPGAHGGRGAPGSEPKLPYGLAVRRLLPDLREAVAA